MALKTPMFNNSHDMKTNDVFAVILLMKHDRDPFFLWLLAQFCAGAKAPTEMVTRPRPSPSPTKKSVKRKRGRGGAAVAARTAPATGEQPCKTTGDQAGPQEEAMAARRGAATPPTSTSGVATPGQGPPATRSVVGTPSGKDGEDAVEARPPGLLAGDGDGARGTDGTSKAVPDRPASAASSGVALPSCAAFQELYARQLLSGDRVVAMADIHPEFGSFHSSPVPPSVVACFWCTWRTAAPRWYILTDRMLSNAWRRAIRP